MKVGLIRGNKGRIEIMKTLIISFLILLLTSDFLTLLGMNMGIVTWSGLFLAILTFILGIRFGKEMEEQRYDRS